MRNHTLVILFSLFFLLTQPSPGLLDDMLTKSPGGSPTPAEPESPTPAPEWIKTVETALHKGIQHGADAMEKPLEAVKPHIKDAVEKGMAVASAAYLLCSDTDGTPRSPLPPPKAILLFVADDLGYNDTTAYGNNGGVPCPNVQKLAVQGLLFTDAHSTNSVCTPSRYSMLTGQYAWRQRDTGILPGDAALIIPTRDKAATLGTLMQQAGYRTAAIGKWHLGLGAGNIDWNRPISPAPAEVGFDYSFIMAATGDRVPCVYVENGQVKHLDPQDPIEVNYRGRAYPGIPTAASPPTPGVAANTHSLKAAPAYHSSSPGQAALHQAQAQLSSARWIYPAPSPHSAAYKHPVTASETAKTCFPPFWDSARPDALI